MAVVVAREFVRGRVYDTGTYTNFTRAVIPLPWYDTLLDSTQSELRIETYHPSDATSTSSATIIATDSSPEIPIITESTTTDNNAQPKVDSNEIESFLRYPVITSTKKTQNTKKSNPMPYRLTGKGYKEHLEMIREEKRSKEEVKDNEKKRRAEAKQKENRRKLEEKENQKKARKNKLSKWCQRDY